MKGVPKCVHDRIRTLFLSVLSGDAGDTGQLGQ